MSYENPRERGIALDAITDVTRMFLADKKSGDLRKCGPGNTSYSSKQILLPFLKNKEYTLLEILCDHVPKWLENDQIGLELRITIEKYKDCMMVKVYPVKS